MADRRTDAGHRAAWLVLALDAAGEIPVPQTREALAVALDRDYRERLARDPDPEHEEDRMTTEHTSHGPAKGPGRGSPAHPPFTSGNLAALKHGAGSPRLVNPLARAFVEAIAERVPYLDADPTFSPAVWAWARAEARVQLIAEWIDANGGPLDEDGVPRPALAALQAAETTAAKARERAERRHSTEGGS